MTVGARAALLLVLLAAPAAARAAGQPLPLRAADGVMLAATLYEAGADAPAVVLVHMYTRSKDDWRPFAERLQASGITALAVDLRGHGASGGDPTPAVAMALDVRAAVDALSARPAVRGIGIVGASLGASAAVLAAAETTLVRSLVLLSPAADDHGLRLEPAARKYRDRPMLLVASAADPYAVRTVKSLLSETTPGREQRVSPVVAHGSQLIDRDPDLATAVVDWLRRTLLS